MDYKKKIIDSTTEIFTSMVMMEIESSGDESGLDGTLVNSITGVIGLAGSYKGVLAIHLPHKIALDITSNFLGMDVEEINEDVEDAVGEIANMIGGDVKGFLASAGGDINISLPSTISGASYEFQPTKNAEKFLVPFKTGSGQFVVELQLEKA